MTDHDPLCIDEDCPLCAGEPEPGFSEDDVIAIMRLGVETRQWAWDECSAFEGTFEDRLLAARRLAAWALSGGDLVLEDETPGDQPLKPGQPGDWH